MKMLLVAGALLLASTAQAQSSNPEIPIEVVEAIAALPGPERSADGAVQDFASQTADMLFDPARDATADVDAAMAAARTSGKHVMIVFGGAWCHDSIALIDAILSPRFVEKLTDRYELAFVNVPFDTDRRAIPVAQRFGIAEVEGTPTVLILRPDGTPINLTDAPRWRNAASRKPAAIQRSLERAAPAIAP